MKSFAEKFCWPSPGCVCLCLALTQTSSHPGTEIFISPLNAQGLWVSTYHCPNDTWGPGSLQGLYKLWADKDTPQWATFGSYCNSLRNETSSRRVTQCLFLFEEELCNRRGLDSTPRNNCGELVATKVLFYATVPTTGSTILSQKMPDSNRLFCEYLSICNRNLEMAVTKGGVALGSCSYQGSLPPAP